MLNFRTQSLQDGEDPQDPTCRFWFDLIEGIPGMEGPDVRGEDVIAPGREGHYVGNRVRDTLNLLIEGFIRGVGSTKLERQFSWRESSELILPVFDRSDNPGTLLLGPGSIGYLGLLDDWTVQARTVDPQMGPILNHMSFQRWSFKLESVHEDFWDVVPS